MRKKITALVLAMVMMFGVVGAAIASKDSGKWVFEDFDREFSQCLKLEKAQEGFWLVGPAIENKDGKSTWNYIHKIQIEPEEMSFDKATGIYTVVGAIFNPAKIEAKGFNGLFRKQVYATQSFKGADAVKAVTMGDAVYKKDVKLLSINDKYALVEVVIPEAEIKKLNIAKGDKLNIQVFAEWVYGQELKETLYPIGDVMTIFVDGVDN
jgi:hypothetical protein